jgi:hypothetical protein
MLCFCYVGVKSNNLTCIIDVSNELNPRVGKLRMQQNDARGKIALWGPTLLNRKVKTRHRNSKT